MWTLCGVMVVMDLMVVINNHGPLRAAVGGDPLEFELSLDKKLLTIVVLYYVNCCCLSFTRTQFSPFGAASIRKYASYSSL